MALKEVSRIRITPLALSLRFVLIAIFFPTAFVGGDWMNIEVLIDDVMMYEYYYSL